LFGYLVTVGYFCRKISNYPLFINHYLLSIKEMADIHAQYLNCPIRHVVSRFGDKWSMLVLFMLHKSDSGVLRFNEIRKLMTDCSQKMLSQTLKNLESCHLVHRKVYPEVPPRVEYSLTDTGKDLMPALTALIAWGKEHFNEVVTD
jgi:DNA-binding HxlR family transcriptional regulator